MPDLSKDVLIAAMAAAAAVMGGVGARAMEWALAQWKARRHDARDAQADATKVVLAEKAQIAQFIADYQRRLESLETEVRVLRQERENLALENIGLRSRVSELESEVARLNAEIAQLQGNAATA